MATNEQSVNSLGVIPRGKLTKKNRSSKMKVAELLKQIGEQEAGMEDTVKQPRPAMRPAKKEEMPAEDEKETKLDAMLQKVFKRIQVRKPNKLEAFAKYQELLEILLKNSRFVEGRMVRLVRDFFMGI